MSRHLQNADRSLMETRNGIAQIIGREELNCYLRRKEIVLFCMHTQKFKDNLLLVCSFLTVLNPGLVDNHGFKG